MGDKWIQVKWVKHADINAYLARGWHIRSFSGSAAFGVWMERFIEAGVEL